MSSITGTFEEFCLKFQNTFCAKHFSVAVSWNYVIVSTLSLEGTPSLWNTFESASFALDTENVVKISNGVCIHFTTKLKKSKVQNWVDTDIFKQHFR